MKKYTSVDEFCNNILQKITEKEITNTDMTKDIRKKYNKYFKEGIKLFKGNIRSYITSSSRFFIPSCVSPVFS